MNIEFNSSSATATQRVGQSLATLLPSGAALGLCGPLGAGKTCLTKGLAAGLNIPPETPIVSPTFILLREYVGDRLLYHLDLYRLSGFDELLDLGWEELRNDDALLVVEWADRIAELANEIDLWVELAHAGGDSRSIKIHGKLLEANPAIRDRLADSTH